ncbi:uncharacterized protein NPIL_395681 [Nephila pilipes]|uniref:Uncharacterized protein n=1 Tax=Nephila pilipes TaxID=299642 RepID=A0A8X6JC21_NEPPI|nr:uncharacterized protein NPIL_395681 [Nephila pilipes]
MPRQETSLSNVHGKNCDQFLFNYKFSQRNSNMQCRKTYLNGIIFKFFIWIGLVQETDPSLKRRKTWLVFICLLLFVITDTVILGIIHSDVVEMKVNITCNVAFICCLMVWYSMRRKNKRLAIALLKLQDIDPSPNSMTSNAVALLILSLPIIFSVLCAFKSDRRVISRFYAYRNEVESVTIQIIIISIKKAIQFFFYPIFPCLVSFLYVTICLRCSVFIRDLTNRVIQHSPETFGPSPQIDVLRNKARIDDVLDNIQAVFSFPSFFVVVSSFLTCCSALGFILMATKDNYSTDAVLVVVFYAITNSTCLMGILWFAGGVPFELKKLKKSFYKKAQLRLIFVRPSKEPQCKREIMEKPDFVFMGCDILSYKRSSIFVVIGTLLTYTVLVVKEVIATLKLENYISISWWSAFVPLFICDGLNAYFCVIVFIRQYLEDIYC